MKIPEQAFSELRALYAELAQALEPFRRHCDSRGTCCNFDFTGHMLYVTGLEAAEMARAGVTPKVEQAQAGTCPFLDGKLCGIRDYRALGCRIYYCDKTYEEQRNAVYETFLAKVRQIETRYGLEHSYAPVTKVQFEKVAEA
jgi:Fe-S-cluster containining protein